MRFEKKMEGMCTDRKKNNKEKNLLFFKTLLNRDVRRFKSELSKRKNMNVLTLFISFFDCFK